MIQPINSECHGIFGTINAVYRETFACAEPKVGARAASDLQQAHTESVGAVVEITRDKPNQLFSRVSTPWLTLENLFPTRIPCHADHLLIGFGESECFPAQWRWGLKWT
jgi:hypothetical protein